MSRILVVVVVLGAASSWAKDAPDAGARAAVSSSVQKLDVAQFRSELEKARASGKFTLLDVREPAETGLGSVQGAELMPYTSGAFARDHASIPKDRPVLIYCASGARAGRAAQILATEGWKDVFVLSGGGYEDLRPAPR